MNKVKQTGPMQPFDPRLHGFATAAEAARFLGLSRAMITKLVATGQIPYRRYGASLRIPWAFLLSELEKTTEAANPTA
jgi:excisionase family DNA binding protein